MALKMALSQQTIDFLNSMKSTEPKPFYLSEIKDIRSSMGSFIFLQNEKEKVFSITDITYSGNEKLRIYIPSESPKNNEGLPVIVYYHGGGFVAGDLEVCDEFCRTLSVNNESIVVSVDYRLAPENTFPSAHIDAIQGLKWVVENINKYGGNRKLSIIGDSVGGNLAACTTLWAVENDIEISNQILISPILNQEIGNILDSSDLEIMITKKDIEWFWATYKVTNNSEVKFNPYQFDITDKIPRTLIISMEHEVMRGDAEKYGFNLIEQGVSTTIKRIPGVIHGIIWASKVFPEHKVIDEEIVRFLKV